MFSRQKTKKNIFVFFFLLLNIFLVFSSLTQAYDFNKNSGLESTAQETGHKKVAIFKDGLEAGIPAILQIVSSFLGVLFLVYMIYGGIVWMTARGNDQRIDKAKNIIVDSITGLVIVAAAYAISYFIISALTANNLTVRS